MLTGKTGTGFKYTIDERAVTDSRLLDAILETTDTEGTVAQMRAIKKIRDLLLGKDGVEKLRDHIAKKNGGFVPVEIEMQEVMEIMADCNKTKNS